MRFTEMLSGVSKLSTIREAAVEGRKSYVDFTEIIKEIMGKAFRYPPPHELSRSTINISLKNATTAHATPVLRESPLR